MISYMSYNGVDNQIYFNLTHNYQKWIQMYFRSNTQTKTIPIVTLLIHPIPIYTHPGSLIPVLLILAPFHTKLIVSLNNG